ncbi:uncharacterized protein LOC102802818 [Saccoglossus kowalevskii]
MHTTTLLVVAVATIVCIYAAPYDDFWNKQPERKTDDKRQTGKVKYNQFHHLGIGKRRDNSLETPEHKSDLEKLLYRYFLQLLDNEMARQTLTPGQEYVNESVEDDMGDGLILS